MQDLYTKILVWGTVAIALLTAGIFLLAYLAYSHPSSATPAPATSAPAEVPLTPAATTSSSPPAPPEATQQTQPTATFEQPTTPAATGSVLGDINFAGYCASVYDLRVELVSDDITGWKCVSATSLIGMDVDSVCSWQYGTQAAASNWTNYNDPFSWYCQQ
jgi:hypothetical protein